MMPMEKNKYCEFSVVSKYLGYDIAAESKKIQNDNNTNPTESIPCAILEMVILKKILTVFVKDRIIITIL
jgi:hypothetical protein